MVIFRALRATLVHFADFVTGHGTSCAPCAVRHTPGALCTFIRAYSNSVSADGMYFAWVQRKTACENANQVKQEANLLQRQPMQPKKMRVSSPPRFFPDIYEEFARYQWEIPHRTASPEWSCKEKLLKLCFRI